MISRISQSLMAVILMAFVFAGCSKEDDDDQNQTDPNMPSNVSDPADLPSGGAEASGAGAESFAFTDLQAEWRKAGATTWNGRTYANTELTLQDSTGDLSVSINFLVYDTAATMFGGKLPEPGMFDIGLTLQQMQNENTEAYAEIYVSGESLEYDYSHATESGGGITITSFENGVMMGKVDVQDLPDFDDDDIKLNLAASFKAEEE